MIVLNLSCNNEHHFEGWFGSAELFQKQQDAGQLSCPVCNSPRVSKLPSAPYVQSSKHKEAPRAAAMQPDTALAGGAAEVLNQLLEKLREHANQAEDVGQAFADEARRIHEGQAQERAIRGQASATEMIALLEDGISVLPIPPAKDDLH